MFYAILAAALVVLDQIVKYLVRAHIPLGGAVPFIPYLLELTYVQNTGAAFSLLRQHTWLLTLTSAAVVLVMCRLILTGFFRNRLGLFSAALVLAGGMGNLIDRVPDHLHGFRRVQRGRLLHHRGGAPAVFVCAAVYGQGRKKGGRGR
jgi:signal peptidase II